MSERNPNSPSGSFGQAVDKRIGDAFPVIEAVYSKLAQLTYLAENLQVSQPKQIEIRANDDLGAIEWHYIDEPWNILVEYTALFGIDRDQLFADLTALLDARTYAIDLLTSQNEAYVQQGNVILGQVQAAFNNINTAIQIHSSSADHDSRYLRSQVDQSAPKLKDIPVSGITGLQTRLEGLESALGGSGEQATIGQRLALLEAAAVTPLFDQIFSYNNEPLDLRLLLNRPSPSTYIENGSVKNAMNDEPVFEEGSLRLASAATNLTLGDLTLAQGIACTVAKYITYGFKPTQEYIVTADNSETPPTVRLLSTNTITTTTYSIQVIVKAGSRNITTLKFAVYPADAGAAEESRADFSLNVDGSVIFQSPNVKGKITKLAGGRFLCAATYTGVALDASLLETFVGFSSGTTGGETIYISNAQSNTGLYTPYIDTFTTTKSRNKDNFRITDGEFKSLMNPLQGTIVLDFKASELCTKRILRLSDDDEAGWELRLVNQKIELASIAGEDATVNSVTGLTLDNPEARKRVAVSWVGTLLTLYVLGEAYGPIIYTDAENMNKLVSDPFDNTSWINLYRLRIYNTKLPAEQLKAITL